MKKILILFGGPSHEHTISCKSAETILKNIDYSRYDVTTVGITKENIWLLIPNNIPLEDSWPTHKTTVILDIIPFLKTFDKVFPIIHGSPCESGELLAFFQLFNINYVGSNYQSSLISYDKELTKIVLSKHNIPIIPYITIKENKKIKSIPLSFPVIIKPAKCGSSLGINIATNIKELNKYLKIAFNYDDKVIIEKYIKSRELECAILKNKKTIISPVGEIRASNTFYDYEAKYSKDSTLIIPAKIPPELTKEIINLTTTISNILSISNLARFDFLYDYHEEKLYFNEVNTIPGFTSSSMYPLLFNHLGIPLKDLITILIDN